MTGEHGRAIKYLSPPSPVSMGDSWFDIADLNHFWIRRRFEVLERLAGGIVRHSSECAEIGCGNGLLQRQVEDRFGVAVTGFDLNDFALRTNLSRSPVYCYNIHERSSAMRAKYDVIFLFDVIEHVADDSLFLESARYHLAANG